MLLIQRDSHRGIYRYAELETVVSVEGLLQAALDC